MKMDRFCLELRYSLIRQPPRGFAEPKVDGSSSMNEGVELLAAMIAL